jgi:hypothetical protein
MCSRPPRSGPCRNERTTRFAAFVGRSVAIWNLVRRQIKPYLSWFKKLGPDVRVWHERDEPGGSGDVGWIGTSGLRIEPTRLTHVGHLVQPDPAFWEDLPGSRTRAVIIATSAAKAAKANGGANASAL